MNEKNIQAATPSKDELNKLIRNHMIAAIGAGLVPFPVADLAAMTGVQINLVRKIASAFGVPFSQNAVKSLIGAIVGGAVPAYGAPSLASLAKVIPVAGSIIGFVAMPTLSVAMTYAVGHVFIQHFESGGTLLTFDVKKAGDLFKGLFKKGQEEAAVMAKEGDQEGKDESQTAENASDGGGEAAASAKEEKAPKKRRTQ
jgi:uncharacterized protein (DUF697 family)